jgi:hypothetical protein
MFLLPQKFISAGTGAGVCTIMYTCFFIIYREISILTAKSQGESWQATDHESILGPSAATGVAKCNATF